MTNSHLFSPLQLRALTSANRAVLSPMCQYQAVNGYVQDWHYSHHARFAAGGLGIAFVEATAVLPEGRITPGCTGLWEDGQIEGLARIARLYKSAGTLAGLQLGHAGRRASAARPWDGAAPLPLDGLEPGWQTVGPSAIPEREGYPVPSELGDGEIDQVIHAFRDAACRAVSAGFDIVEVHGAHGYLLHQFFSAHANRRTDAFGGNLENRMRLPLAVASAVREVWPIDKPVFYRISAVDNVPNGVVIEDAIALAIELKRVGIDVIDCSSGGMTGPTSTSAAKIKPCYQLPYSEAIKGNASVKTMAVGAILEPHHAEDILAAGGADLIALGRQLMAEPHWLYRAAHALGQPDPHTAISRYYGFYLQRRESALERRL